MKSRGLACALALFGLMSFGYACKGDGGDGGGFITVLQVSPEKNRTDVQVATRIGFEIDASIDPDTLTNETFFVTDSDGVRVEGALAIGDEPSIAVLTPDLPLDVITSFTATITTELSSSSGATLEEDFQWKFETLDAAWGESEWIEPFDSANKSSEQEIAVDEQLNAIAVWESDDGTGIHIHANRYTRVDLWGEAGRISDGNGDSTNPKVALDAAGNGFAVWERKEEGSSIRNIWTNRYDVVDGSWGTPALLQTGDVTAARVPAVAADPAGNAIAVWIQRDTATDNEVVRAIRYEADTGWANEVTIGEPGLIIAGARTAVGMDDDGNAIAVWDPAVGAAGAGTRVLWANRYTTGLGWEGVTPIKSDESTSANGFRLDVGAGGDAFVIWVQDDRTVMPPRDDVWAVRFSENTWGDPGRIDNYEDGDKQDPDIAVDGTGTAYAVWSQADPDFENIWANTYTPDSTWGTPEGIEPPNEDPNEDGDAATPRVDVNRSGNAFVVWRQIWNDWGSVWSNRRDPGSGWMTAELIEDLERAASLPKIAVDDGRHAHALWPHSIAFDTNLLRTNRFE
jgi:hypothetical protein